MHVVCIQYVFMYVLYICIIAIFSYVHVYVLSIAINCIKHHFIFIVSSYFLTNIPRQVHAISSFSTHFSNSFLIYSMALQSAAEQAARKPTYADVCGRMLTYADVYGIAVGC
jgi:hypothetical protein